MTDSLKNSRRDFEKSVLLENALPNNPLELLLEWYQDAVKVSEPDANAMTLATLDLEGYPVSRVVLMRDASAKGITFFTNYQSAKGQQIAAHPKAEVQFFWKLLERQVRIRGGVEKVSPSESDAYFASRPRDSQIGAWASPQSSVITSREQLEDMVQNHVTRFAGQASIPRPPHWGGFRLIPIDFEFWQGRPSRLHDRLKALRQNEQWTWQRLAP